MSAVDIQELTVRPMNESLVEAWRKPWANLAGDFFMDHPVWQLNAWQHFHRNQPGVSDFVFLTVSDDHSNESLVGCSAWFRQTERGVNWWRLVGSGSVCSDYVHMPCEAGQEERVTIALADWFDAQPRKLFDLPSAVEVDGHRANSSEWCSFFSQLQRKGWRRNSVEIEGTWKIALPTDWNDYESALPRSRHRTVKSLHKRLQKGEVEFVACRSVPEIEKAWPDFVRLHQARRQELGQPGCFADAHFERFLRTAVLEMAAEGGAWISTIEANGRIIAALLIFDCGQTSYFYQQGIDIEQKKLEPGNLAIAATIEELIRRGQRSFDLLRGDEPYKEQWLSTRTSLMRTILFPPGVSGRSLSAAFNLRRNIQGWWKRDNQ